MRPFILTLFLAALALAGCSPKPANPSTPAPAADTKTTAPYPDLGAAPELINDTWLNTHTPLRLAALRGKVVLLDMWTFG